MIKSNGYRRAVKAPEETKAGEDVITVTQPNSGISIIDQAKNVISARLGDIEILLTSPEDFLLKFKEDVSTSIVIQRKKPDFPNQCYRNLPMLLFF